MKIIIIKYASTWKTVQFQGTATTAGISTYKSVLDSANILNPELDPPEF